MIAQPNAPPYPPLAEGFAQNGSCKSFLARYFLRFPAGLALPLPEFRLHAPDWLGSDGHPVNASRDSITSWQVDQKNQLSKNGCMEICGRWGSRSTMR